MQARLPPLSPLILSALLVGGCGLDRFSVDLQDQVTVPGMFQGNLFSPAFGGSFGSLNLASDKSFANAGVKPSDVDSISLKSVSLTDSQPRLNGLSGTVESIQLFVSAPGQQKKLIASGSGFPAGGVANLTVEPGVNLKPYAVASSMSFSAELKLKSTPQFTFVITVNITLDVDINLLGA